jgi:hypothetical protein
MRKNSSIFLSLLKKHTNIDVNFINTFFTKFQIGDDLQFHINEKDVSEYLNISRDQLRDRLNNKYMKKYYIENADYIKIRTGITTQVIYYLNYPCFEKIAMGCDSIMSFRIKEYFIELRKFIMRYEKIINQSIETHKLLIMILFIFLQLINQIRILLN